MKQCACVCYLGRPSRLLQRKTWIHANRLSSSYLLCIHISPRSLLCNRYKSLNRSASLPHPVVPPLAIALSPSRFLSREHESYLNTLSFFSKRIFSQPLHSVAQPHFSIPFQQSHISCSARYRTPYLSTAHPAFKHSLLQSLPPSASTNSPAGEQVSHAQPAPGTSPNGPHRENCVNSSKNKPCASSSSAAGPAAT